MQNGEIFSSRIKWLMILRTVVISIILGIAVVLHLRGTRDFFPVQLLGLYAVAGLAYLLGLLYAVLGRVIRPSHIFGYIQLMVDNLLISALIVITGGVDSLFVNLYFLTAIGASIIFFRRGGLLVTFQGGSFYLLAVFLPYLTHYFHWLDPEGRYAMFSFGYVFYRGALNVVSFFIVSWLASYLSEALRRADEALIASESDLAELQSLYENIVQSISSGLMTADLKGRIVSFNRAAQKITGLPENRWRGAEFFSLFKLSKPWDPFTYNWSPREFGRRLEGTMSGNPTLILGMTFSPLRDDQGVINGVVCSFQDLTEIKKLEEQIKRSDRLAAIGEMAAGVAHEIRNPLASISGSIQVLKDEVPLNDSTRGLMDIVTNETERLNRIISDFLLFANPRPLRTVAVDPVTLLRDTLSLLEKTPDGAPRPHHFLIDDRNRGRKVPLDPQLMRQVFWNLSLNALQAMPSGGTLRIRLDRTDEAGERIERSPGEWLIMEFIDTGQGIADEDMPRIFTPFFSTKENGTGLGLSIVFKIVEQHQGSIEIETAAGKGSIFRLRLPAQLPVPAATGR